MSESIHHLDDGRWSARYFTDAEWGMSIDATAVESEDGDWAGPAAVPLIDQGRYAD